MKPEDVNLDQIFEIFIAVSDNYVEHCDFYSEDSVSKIRKTGAE